MRSSGVFAILFGVGALGCEPSGEAPIRKEPALDALPQPEVDAGDPSLTEAQRGALDSYLDAQFKSHGWPSLAVGVVLGDTLVYTKGVGADEHTVFRIGSVTKVMTGVALLQLRDRKQLDLDDPVTKYVPELTGHGAVTLRHLVTHSSGIPSVGDGSAKYWTGDRDVSESELLAAIKNAPLEFPPGTKVAYSNFAVALAGVVIARVAGEPYRDVMEGSLFAPLAMTASSFDGTARGNFLTATGYAPATTTFRLGAAEAAGGLYSTVTDVARFLAFEGRAESQLADRDPVLARESLRESQRADPKLPPFGVNWVTGENELGRFVAHNGSVHEFSAAVQLYPARRAAIVALLSTGNSEQLDCVAHQALGALFRATPPPGCTPKLTAVNAAALERTRALFATPNAAGIDAAFSPTFPTSRADLLTFFEGCNATFGACSETKVLGTGDNGTARVQLVCERATANVLIGANPTSGLIETLLVVK